MKGKRAWYLGCRGDQVADRVILLGDPGRVPRFSRYLSDVEAFPVNRGLVTVTGVYKDCRVTLSAFGMGAPIAAIVLHELACLDAKLFLRLGTSIGLPPVKIGDFAIAREAVSGEGTSTAYVGNRAQAGADPELANALAAAAAKFDITFHAGKFASFDAFYRDMFALDAAAENRVRKNLQRLERQNVLAVDMETSAILSVGNELGRRTGSLCASTVDSLKQRKIGKAEQAEVEHKLISIALEALARIKLD